MNNSDLIKIRKAEAKDSAKIFWLIKELSIYEKLEQYVTANEENIKKFSTLGQIF